MSSPDPRLKALDETRRFIRSFEACPTSPPDVWHLLDGLRGHARELLRLGAPAGRIITRFREDLEDDLLRVGIGLTDIESIVASVANGKPVGRVAFAWADCQDWERREAEPEDDDGADAWEPPIPFGEYDLPPFPVKALPERLRAFVEAEASATQTPEDLAAMIGLATGAATCAKKVEINVGGRYREPINIYTVTALNSANRKSNVFRGVTAALADAEAEEVRRTRPVIAAAVEKKKILEERLKQLRGQAAKGSGEGDPERAATELAEEIAEHVVPAAPQFIVDDSTPEHIARALHEQGGRLAIMSPEGGIFDLMGGRYGKGGPNFEVLLKGHAGDDLRVGRVGTGVHYVASPALTVGLAVQLDVIRGLFDIPGFRGRGLLARFLYSIPKSTLGRREVAPPPVDMKVAAAYRADILALLNLPFATGADGEPAPHVLPLSGSAYEGLMRFAEWVEPQLAEGGDFAFISDWAGKLVGAVARVAGVLHMMSHAHSQAPWDIPISLATVERAIGIGRYLIPHAKAAFTEMGADPAIAEAKYILRWIERTAALTFTKRNAFEGTKGRFKTVEKMTPGLTLLIQHGYIREQETARRPGPGRSPSPLFEVNPYSQNSHYSHNPTQDPHSANSANSANETANPGAEDTEVRL